MFYHRFQAQDGTQQEVPLYGDEIFTYCAVCGKEIQVDEELLAAVLETGSFSSSITHGECQSTKEVPT